ncbi:MAG: IS30 family transposase [Mangrovibacterium sp.]
MVERTTSMLLIRKLEHGKNADQLAKVVTDILRPYMKHVLSITSDNGSEFARHKLNSPKLDCKFCFAHSYSSWERGLSEYTNKLVRQYILKKSIFNQYDNEFVKQIQYKINRRPRKILNFEKPKDLFFKFVA